MSTKYNKYIVPPFSGVRFNNGTSAGASGCAICGAPIRTKGRHEAIVINGGSAWGDENSIEDAGHMGAGWKIGNDCHKKYVVRS